MNDGRRTKLLEEVETGRLSELASTELESRFAWLEEDLHRRWAGTSSHGSADRESIYNQLKAIQAIKQLFQRDIDTATMARKQLESE